MDEMEKTVKALIISTSCWLPSSLTSVSGVADDESGVSVTSLSSVGADRNKEVIVCWFGSSRIFFFGGISRFSPDHSKN